MRKNCNYRLRLFNLLLVCVCLAAASPVLAQLVPPPEEGRGKPPLYQEMGKEKWISTIVPQLVNPPTAPAEGWMPPGGVKGFGNGKWEDLYINKKNKLNGRIRAIMLDPTRPMQRIWAGGESSTLMYLDKASNNWETSASWKIVSDKWPCSNISCITYNPGAINEFYVGTGNNYNDFFPGCGIFKSTDAGATWNVIPSTQRPEFAVVRKIMFLNANSILVLTGDSGIYISRDNQNSWYRLPTSGYGSVRATKYLDVANYPGVGLFYAIAPTNQNIASTRIFWIANFFGGGQASALYDTTHTFGNLVFSENALAGDPVYVAMNTNGSHHVNKLMKFNTTTGLLEHRKPPSIAVAPSPAFFVMATAGQEYLYIGGIHDASTFDAANTWDFSALSPGGDINDATCFSHNGESYIAVSCDYGAKINRITPGAETSITLSDINNRILQVYSVARHPERDIYYMGTQDLAGICNAGCEFSHAGDIRKVHIDYDNRALISQSHEFARCQKLGSPDVVTFFRSQVGAWGTLNGFDDVQNRFFCLAGKNNLDSLRWYQLDYSGSIPRYIYHANKLALPVSDREVFSAVYALEDGTHLLIGTQQGNLLRYNYITPGNQTVNLRSSEFGNLPVRFITQNETKTKLYVTLSDNTDSKIMVSSDMGGTWQNVTGNLPRVPVFSLVEHRENGSQLFVGTDYGVWYTLNAGSKNPVWFKDQDMPNFRVTELKYSPDKKKIIASSYGRGIWEYSFCQDDTAATGQQLFFERLTKKDTLQQTFGRHWFQSSSANKWNVVFTANPFPGAGSNGALATLPAPATGKNIGEIYSRNIDSTEAGGAKVTIVFSQGAISNVRNLNMLQVDVSVDCGTTWLNIWSLKADQLVTIRNVLAQNTPESQAAFKKVVIPVPDKICRNNKYRVRIRGEVFAGNAPLFLQSVQFDR